MNNEWQPIETAPRDGSYLWLHESNGTTWRGRWLYEKWTFGVTSNDHEFCVFVNLNPTHWMPLPKPPEAQP